MDFHSVEVTCGSGGNRPLTWGRAGTGSPVRLAAQGRPRHRSREPSGCSYGCRRLERQDRCGRKGHSRQSGGQSGQRLRPVRHSGLIDIHFHIGHGGAPLNWFTPEARAHIGPLGIPADLALQSGVTTLVDAGTAGAETFLQEKEEVIDHAKVRVLAFLNIVANGMNGGLEQSVDQMDPKLCAETIKKYPDIIVGVKTAHFWTEEPWDAEHIPWAAVDRAIDCGNMTNVPVMFDFWPRPERTYADLILKKMRPGDIHTHVFAQQFPIILPDGKLNPIMGQARQRGVIFDVGHGAGSFWFRNAVPAVKQGFVPDSMSTDLHTGNYTVLGMNNVMSKFLAMGVPLDDVIRRS